MTSFPHDWSLTASVRNLEDSVVVLPSNRRANKFIPEPSMNQSLISIVSDKEPTLAMMNLAILTDDQTADLPEVSTCTDWVINVRRHFEHNSPVHTILFQSRDTYKF